MTVAAPYFLAALAILIPVLVAFLVKKQKRVVKVPSTLLWRLGAKSVSRSRRIRDIRRWIALAACLAAVAALAVAAARPGGSRGSNTVYVVDVSGSMADGPVDDAKKYLRGEVAAMGPNGRVAIISAGAEPHILVPPSPPGPLVDAAIAGLTAEKESAALEDALNLAEGMHAHVVVLTDHALDKTSSRGGWTEERLFDRGKKTDNLGIVSLFTRTAPDARDDEEREATVIVTTSSPEKRRARLVVTFNGKTVSDRSIDVPARADATANVTIRGAGKLVARIASDDGKKDAIALDDEASLEEASRKPPHVALIRRKDDVNATAFFIQRALGAAGIKDVDDVDFATLPPDHTDVAVVLQDGPARPHGVPTFYVNTAPPELDIQPVMVMKDGVHLRSIAAEDPLMRGVALDELTSIRAFIAKPPKGARSLVDLDGGSAMIAGGTGKDTWVWMGLDPGESDLVLRVAFPVLVGNLMTQLGGQSQIIVAKTFPREETMLAKSDLPASDALHSAADAHWRMPVSPAALLGVLGALLLAFEAWFSLRTRRAPQKKPA